MIMEVPGGRHVAAAAIADFVEIADFSGAGRV
jgi:hypothetical protein